MFVFFLKARREGLVLEKAGGGYLEKESKSGAPESIGRLTTHFTPSPSFSLNRVSWVSLFELFHILMLTSFWWRLRLFSRITFRSTAFRQFRQFESFLRARVCVHCVFGAACSER